MSNCARHLGPLISSLAALHAAALAMSVLVALAILANASFFGAGAAVGLMAAVAALAGGGFALFVALQRAVGDYRACLSGGPAHLPCQDRGAKLYQALNAIMAALAAVTLGAVAALQTAWLPWVGAAGMVAVAAGIGVLLAALVAFDIDFKAFRDCVDAFTATHVLPPILPGGLIFGVETCPSDMFICPDPFLVTAKPASTPGWWETSRTFVIFVKPDSSGASITGMSAVISDAAGARHRVPPKFILDPQQMQQSFVVAPNEWGVRVWGEDAEKDGLDLSNPVWTADLTVQLSSGTKTARLVFTVS